MAASIRAFIAIELPDTLRQAVGALQKAIGDLGVRLRWVPPENLHLTLRFLGEMPERRIPLIADAVRESVAGQRAFSLAIAGAGAFPDVRRPKVVWLGLGDDVDKLDLLYACLAERLSERGVSPETKPFRGHLTIGRVKSVVDWQQVQTGIDKSGILGKMWFPVSAVSLFKSELTSRGAVYTVLSRALLIPGDGGAIEA